jgi:hypothetical protein
VNEARRGPGVEPERVADADLAHGHDGFFSSTSLAT